MIKFFRKIRQQLLTENKFSKYMIYAFGEIFLVVIGILIALQINNLNEQKKADKLEQKYYCRLLEDVVQDKEQVKILKDAVKNRLKAANNAVRLLHKNELLKTEIGRELALSINAILSDFTLNNSAFEDLKSGANINIIKNKNIIKAINNYFKKVEGHLSIIKVNGDIALDRYFAYEDLHANGWAHFSMIGQRFKNGMETDVYEIMQIDLEETLTEDMKYQLLNDALRYIASNARQLQLYNFIQAEADILLVLLEPNCKINSD